MKDLRKPAVIISLMAAACTPAEPVDNGDIDDGSAYIPTVTWRTASPGNLGFNSAAVSRLIRDIDADVYGAIDGVLVVRNGYLVIEHYNGWSPDTAHTMQSVTKSVTSLLFGMLSQNEAGSRLDQSVVSMFPQYSSIANLDDRKRSLTIQNLLTMRTSMDFWEQPYGGSPLEQLNRSTGDWLRFVLDRPMTGTPGSRWAYNSGAPIVVCGLIRELTADSVHRFARRALFEPLGITGQYWVVSPYDRLPHCGGGLYLKPADLARIGYLVLRNGRWGDRQIVTREWIEASTTPYSRGSDLFFANYNAAYGYYWWLFPQRRGGSDTSVIAASGAGGQWLFVVPELDLVVVVVASNGFGLDLLYNGVLPALGAR